MGVDVRGGTKDDLITNGSWLLERKTAFQTIFTSFQALVLSQGKHTVPLGHREQDKATTQGTALSHMKTEPKSFCRVCEIAPESHIADPFQVDIRIAPSYCFLLAGAGQRLGHGITF